jgi:hypothetical protein
MDTHLPKEISLKASPLKLVGIFLICAFFTIAGFWILSGGENTAAAWLCILFFGAIGIPVCLFQFIRPARLFLNEEGFEQIMMGRRMNCNWHAVSKFGVVSIKRNKFVSFSRLEDEGKTLAHISKIITGGHSGILGDTFGMKAIDLAALMNAFRDRALNQSNNTNSSLNDYN